MGGMSINMAISSITKKYVIRDDKAYERLIKAMENPIRLEDVFTIHPNVSDNYKKGRELLRKYVH